jgi:RNA polymerase sigma factor (TIGR02999 family)
LWYDRIIILARRFAISWGFCARPECRAFLPAAEISGFIRYLLRNIVRFVCDLTLILQKMERGDPQAADQLLPLVYDELRRLAAQKMARESAGQTLQPTALVHEAWLRLGGDQQPTWQNRAHFFGAAAEAMRRILIDRARRRQAMRHGGGQERINVDDLELAAATDDDDRLLAVHDALDKLTAQDPRKAELVKLRYFAGMTIEEAALVLGVSEPTAKRWWAFARTWLFQEIRFR